MRKSNPKKEEILVLLPLLYIFGFIFLALFKFWGFVLGA